MVKIGRFISRNKNLIFRLVFLIAIVFSLLGCYGYYRRTLLGLPRKLSASISGTLDLFAFEPPFDFLEDTSLLYNIAVWLAPISTVFLVLSIFSILYNNIRIRIKSLSKRPYVIFSNDGKAFILLHNTLSETNQVGYILTEEEIDRDLQEKLLSVSGKYINLNLDKIEGRADELVIDIFRKIRIKKAIDIIFWLPDIKSLNKVITVGDYLLQREDRYRTTVIYENENIKNLMEDQIEKISNMDCTFVKVENLFFYKITSPQSLPSNTNKERVDYGQN